MSTEAIVLICVAYLWGSVSTAIIVCKLMGLPDPREGGSGNPGATNVLRIGGEKGKQAAAITLASDLIKGLVPVLVAQSLEFSPLAIASVGFVAFLGHLYPIFFGFKGGKGVATMLGVMLGLSWQIGLAVVLTWLFVAKGLKISSLSALVASVLAPFYIWFLSGQMAWVGISVCMSLILFWRHRGNIERLLKGEER